MAISRKQRISHTHLPDPAPFVRIYEQGLAGLLDVVRAYRHSLAEWRRNGGRVEVQPGDVVQNRADVSRDPEELSIVVLQRQAMWQSSTNTHHQEEA